MNIPLTTNERLILRGELHRTLGDLSKQWIIADREQQHTLREKIENKLATIRKTIHFLQQ